MLITVNSRYSGHPRYRDFVSVIARVRNSGVREKLYFKPYLQKGVTCAFIFINSSTFFRPVVASKERQNFNSYKEFCRLLQNIAHLCLILKNILMGKWHLIENQPLLREMNLDPSLLSYRKERSLENVLVRAKL